MMTIKPNQTKSNQTKPNQTKPNQTKPNQTKPNQTDEETKQGRNGYDERVTSLETRARNLPLPPGAPSGTARDCFLPFPLTPPTAQDRNAPAPSFGQSPPCPPDLPHPCTLKPRTCTSVHSTPWSTSKPRTCTPVHSTPWSPKND